MIFRRKKKIGLALGGGGARGLAHVALLQVFDDLGLRPHRIAGTSIGSVMGALYACGLRAGDIRAVVSKMIIAEGENLRDLLKKKKDAFRWIEFFDFSFNSSGLFKGDNFIRFLYEVMEVKYFKDLEIPLSVVATDFWTSQQVVIESGELLTAVKASMGLPGIFTPVERDGRVMIDGGGVNPVPHDLLTDCDVVVAVDVMGEPGLSASKLPNLVRTILGTFDIMQKSIIREKLKNRPPDIYLKPDIVGVDLLEFHKADQIYAQTKPACERLRKELRRLV